MRLLLAAVVSLAIPATAAASGVDAVPGELLVKLRHGASPQLLRAHGATPGKPLAVPGAVLARVPLRTDLHRAARELARDPRVAWAQPNVYQRGAALPDDSLFGQQWSLNSASGPGIDAPEAWDHTTGSESVRVAIVDSGINYDEPDLAPNIATDAGWDFVQNDGDPSDNVGHGTHVAGIVDLAAPGDDILSSFLKWGAKDSLFKDSFESALAGTWVTGGTPDTWGRSFTYWRTGSWSLSDSPSGQYANNTDNYVALTQGLDLTGKRDCAASVYARTALSDDDLLLAETSPDWVSWGKRIAARSGTSSGFERWLIDLSELEGRADGGLLFRLFANANGTDEGVALDDLEIFCVPPITGFTGAPDEFAIDWGTSMAAPHVTGTAALMLSLAPQLTPGQLKQVILATADPLPSLSGKTVTGGRLNAGSAVGLVADALAQVADPPVQASPPPTSTPSTGQAAPDVSAMLAADLRSSTRTLRLRDLLRRRRLTIRLHHAYPAGTFRLRVTDPARRTIASGSSLTARLTRAGTRRLRHTRRTRLTLALTFAPASGPAVVAARTVVARR